MKWDKAAKEGLIKHLISEKLTYPHFVPDSGNEPDV